MPDAVKSIELEAGSPRDLALVDGADAVWVVIPLRWWDFATVAWYGLMPSDRNAVVTLTTRAGIKHRCRAVRVASKFVRVRGKIQ